MEVGAVAPARAKAISKVFIDPRNTGISALSTCLETREEGSPMRPLAKVLPPLFLALGLLALSGCNKVESVGLYDPTEPEALSPTITGISPAGSAFAGMDTIVIQGTNFSSVLSYNYVYFNTQSAALLSASPTQITLMAPLVTMDSIGVRVSVRGAVAFSNTFQYRLNAGAMVFGGLLAKDTSASLATDASGNVFAAYCNAGKDAGILKISPSGAQTVFAPATSGVLLWTGLKVGPGGYLFAARNIRALYSFTPAGGASATVWLAFPAGTFIADLDFDRDGNMWCGGDNANLYKVNQSKVYTAYPFVGKVRSIRVFNDYLYFAAKTAAGEKIWRAPITAGALGTPEVYWDFGAAFPGKTPLAITFASDGTLYVGTDAQDGLLIVSTSKTVTAPYSAYKSLFATGIDFLAWGSEDRLYASTISGALLKFAIRGKTGAPYYGSTL